MKLLHIENQRRSIYSLLATIMQHLSLGAKVLNLDPSSRLEKSRGFYAGVCNDTEKPEHYGSQWFKVIVPHDWIIGELSLS
jgi:hypothetical protein